MFNTSYPLLPRIEAPLLPPDLLQRLATQHKEEASSSSLITEEEMEEITLVSISPPLLIHPILIYSNITID